MNMPNELRIDILKCLLKFEGDSRPAANINIRRNPLSSQTYPDPAPHDLQIEALIIAEYVSNDPDKCYYPIRLHRLRRKSHDVYEYSTNSKAIIKEAYIAYTAWLERYLMTAYKDGVELTTFDPNPLLDVGITFD